MQAEVGHGVTLYARCRASQRIITDSVARGELAAADPAATARAVFDATGRFHNRAHAAEWADAGIDSAFEAVWSLVLAGLGGAVDAR